MHKGKCAYLKTGSRISAFPVYFKLFLTFFEGGSCKMQCSKNLRNIVFSTLPLLFFFCSTDDKIVGTVDDTDTGISVFLPDSTPAVDAIIKFIPSTRSQTTVLAKKSATTSAAVAVVKTDSTGRFRVPALADSTYNIFMEKGDLKAFQGEVVITSQGNTIHDDTLQKTGSFSAIVGLDLKDMHNVGSVAVQILGSDVQYLNPDKKGTFTFNDIAPGNYKLRLETSLPEYSPTYFTMTIKSNLDSISPDTIFIKYNGIPSVHGLSAEFDTSFGIVKLSWDSAGYSNILDYVVFRDAEPTVTYSSIPFKATSATSLVDTIFDIHKTAIDTQNLAYKYRVAIRNNSTTIGNTFGAVSVTATPYKSVLPIVDSIKVSFDTLSGTTNLSWQSVPIIDSSYDYLLIRTISRTNSSGLSGELQSAIDSTDTIGHLPLPLFTDSLFGKRIPFSDLSPYYVSYTISVYKKQWKLSGKDAISTSLLISPYKARVPKVTNSAISFDTLHGVALLSWDSIPAASGVSGYRVIRTVTPLIQPAKTDTLPLLVSHAFTDTIFPKLISFEEINQVKITYTISAFHSLWNVYGIERAVSDTVYSFKAFLPLISAGMNQTVDISSDVLLVGSVMAATYPVTKREWKIGDSEWVTGGDSIQFRTNSEHTREIFPCLFRVTDSVGNVAVDTVVVTKTPLMVSLGKFPSYMQGTTVVIPLLKKIDSQNEFLSFGYISNLYAIWSTSDFKNYSIVSTNTGITNPGTFFSFQNNYYVYNIPSLAFSSKSFKSSDGISWSEIQPVINQGNSYAWPSGIKFLTRKDDILLITSKYIEYIDNKSIYENILYKTNDGLIWDSISSTMPQEQVTALLTLNNSLCLITSYNKYTSSDGGISWSPEKLWDTDGDLFPDDFYSFASSDSVTLITYQERPSFVKKMVMYKNGTWKVLPIDILNITPSSNSYSDIFITGNRCLFVEKPSLGSSEYSVRSFKLY